jgi:hypothetical protein
MARRRAKAALPRISEREFQAQVCELAGRLGWLRAHFRPARTKAGWRTAMIGNKGFPDTVLARRGVLYFWELKVPPGRPTPEQIVWLEVLTRCLGPASVKVYYPADWPAIQRALR